MDPARKLPTLADLEALPRGIKGEIIEGVLYTMTRPRGGDETEARVPPFDAVPLDVASLWT